MATNLGLERVDFGSLHIDISSGTIKNDVGLDLLDESRAEIFTTREQQLIEQLAQYAALVQAPQKEVCDYLLDQKITLPLAKLKAALKATGRSGHDPESFEGRVLKTARLDLFYICRSVGFAHDNYPGIYQALENLPEPAKALEFFTRDDALVTTLAVAWRTSKFGPIAFDPRDLPLTEFQKEAIRRLRGIRGETYNPNDSYPSLLGSYVRQSTLMSRALAKNLGRTGWAADQETVLRPPKA